MLDLREENGRRRELFDELFLDGRQIVETVEEDRRWALGDGRRGEAVIFQPMPVSLVGGGEFAALLGLAGEFSDAGLFEVFEGFQERGGEAGSGSHRGEVVPFPAARELPAEKFEAESRGDWGGEKSVEGFEMNVGVGREFAAEMQPEQMRRDDHGQWGELTVGFLVGGDFFRERGFENRLEWAEVEFARLGHN